MNEHLKGYFAYYKRQTVVIYAAESNTARILAAQALGVPASKERNIRLFNRQLPTVKETVCLNKNNNQ